MIKKLFRKFKRKICSHKWYKTTGTENDPFRRECIKCGTLQSGRIEVWKEIKHWINIPKCYKSDPHLQEQIDNKCFDCYIVNKCLGVKLLGK